MLNWVTASSADDRHDDIEADLAVLGNPGGGEWVSVASDWDRIRNCEVWTWEVMDRWLYEDADLIAGGTHDTRAEAIESAESWVKGHVDTVQSVSKGGKLRRVLNAIFK